MARCSSHKTRRERLIDPSLRWNKPTQANRLDQNGTADARGKTTPLQKDGERTAPSLTQTNCSVDKTGLQGAQNRGSERSNCLICSFMWSIVRAGTNRKQ